jgi:hypothetical protein
VLALLLPALVTGSLVYCILTIIAAIRYRRVRPPELRAPAPVSVLKPLAGVDDGLESNLRTFFEQDYPDFEILFAVRSANDPAIAVAERLRTEYPRVPSRLLVTGEPPYPNAKVYSLDLMLAAAGHDLIVMSDSDIRVTPQMLRVIAAEFQDPALGLATCPYRAVPGASFWNTLEAIGLNTEFIGGVLVARMLDGMKFALGPTIAARRATLAGIGGFDAVKDFLAEDFVMGKLAAERGDGVILSSYVIDHCIGSQTSGCQSQASPALESQHTPIAPGRIYRTTVHKPSAPGARAVARPTFVVAPGCCRGGVARRRRLGHRRTRTPRSPDRAPLLAGAAPGPAELCDVGGRLLRQHDSLARPQILFTGGRSV